MNYNIPGVTYLTDNPVTVSTDGGPWAEHTMPCAVCHRNRAIMQLDGWHFHPCDNCKSNGWRLMKLSWLQRVLMFACPERR